MLTDLRKLTWLYLILLIFEGALRKWIIPALDAPLLLVRDPVVVWIYIQAWRNGLSFNNLFNASNLFLAVVTTLLSLAFGLMAGTTGMFITAFGFRTDYLQIPFIFLMPQILNRDDVVAMGKFLLYCAVPMAFLVLLQFHSAPNSIWNKGAMATHYGTVRPSGTFSFVTGLSSYWTLVSAFLLYGFLRTGTYKLWLLVLVTFCVLAGAALSGSRLTLMSVAIVTIVAVLCVITKGRGGFGMLIAGVIIALAVAALSSTSVFQEGTEQLGERFVDAGRTEGNASGFVQRFLDSMLVAGAMMNTTPLFGYGLGMGTNVGFGLYDGNLMLLWPEAEWARLVFECGAIFGLALCFFRAALTGYVGLQAFSAYRDNNFLPILLFGASGLQILNGQWGVPTSLGFAILGAGLILAACVEPHDWEDEEYDEELGDDAAGHEEEAADSVG